MKDGDNKQCYTHTKAGVKEMTCTENGHRKIHYVTVPHGRSKFSAVEDIIIKENSE